jgi:uncharacterized protein (TIGR02246 family)
MSLKGLLATTLTVAVAATAIAMVRAQQKTSAPALTPLDYIELQQLVARYAYALDTGANDGTGSVYASLFTPDGVFVGGASGRVAKGREQLAALARVAPGGTRGPLTVGHYIVNHVIEPSPEGAIGKQYLAYLTFGDEGQGGSINLGGHYEDIYAKTADGWRFRRREFIPSKSGPQGTQSPAVR